MCVREIHEPEARDDAPLINNPERDLRREGSLSSGTRMSLREVAESPDTIPSNGFSDDLVRSRCLHSMESHGKWTSFGGRDSSVAPADAAPPRLSLKPGFLSTREAVKDWREWTPKAPPTGVAPFGN